MSSTPKLLYLDQFDLSNLAKGKAQEAAASRLSKLLSQRKVTLVISRTHVFETARCGDRAIKEQIVAFVDGQPQKLWLWPSTDIDKAELAHAFLVALKCPTPVRPYPFTGSILEYAQRFPNCDTTSWDSTREFARLVDSFGRARSPELHRRANDWPKLCGWLRSNTMYKRPTEAEKRVFLRNYMPNRTPAGLYVDACGLMKDVDLDLCPATMLGLDLTDMAKRDSQTRVESSDLFDRNRIDAIPYCDMTTLDKRWHDLVVRTKSGKRYLNRIACNLGEALDKMGSS